MISCCFSVHGSWEEQNCEISKLDVFNNPADVTPFFIPLHSICGVCWIFWV